MYQLLVEVLSELYLLGHIVVQVLVKFNFCARLIDSIGCRAHSDYVVNTPLYHGTADVFNPENKLPDTRQLLFWIKKDVLKSEPVDWDLPLLRHFEPEVVPS